jgi:Rps23 Pro-64 3,4-dihydroxylase Tpa1-like proline 4-hydroxylase
MHSTETSRAAVQALQALTIDRFLPLSRMKELAASAYTMYVKAVPFPHIVLDDFFDPELVDLVLSEFPQPGAIRWQQFDNEHEIKLASAAESSFGPVTRLFLYHLNSITFLEFLSAITGIPHLISDPSFDGGGLHQIVRGGKLGVHADFNRHGTYDLDRRLNLLLYLNKDWREEYGGHLQLWNRGMTRCETKVLPIFNRVMIFGTTDFTYHGHPDPLQCPEGMTRKSLALYYFSNGRPAEEVSGSHSTVFRARHESEFKRTTAQRLRAIARDLLPPIIVRRLQKRTRTPRASS